MGGWLQFGRGELGWERKMRNRGGENRQSVYILPFIDGITDGLLSSVYPSVHLTVKGPRHYMKILVSLYGDPGLNPSIILSVKSSEKIQHHHIISCFQNST
jgi:hypothetical protein